ncbi:MAG: hypothetical protein GX616_18575 [Planctomycetes bacterium]|nr:hypothetical protein [Planctomycetota bacterium]
MPALAQGGAMNQSISLKAGWNLVWFSVQPQPDDPAPVLGAVDYDGIWSFEPGLNSTDKGHWVSYIKGQPDFVNTLGHLQAGRGYLIRMKTAGTLNLQGIPVSRSRTFQGSRSTLFGLHLPPGQAPTFNDYFSFSGASGNIQAIYKLVGNAFSPVSPLSQIESDVSYWIMFTRDLQYSGPFKVNAPADGYQFGKRGYMTRIVVEVQASNLSQSLTVKSLPAATPPSDKPADAGNGDAAWLEYSSVTPATATEPEKREWKPLTGGTAIDIPSGQTRDELEIRCNRKGREAATIETTNSLYQALIQISDSKNNTAAFAAGMEVAAHYGVYAGQTRLNRVSTRTTTSQPSTMASADPMVASLILSLASPAEGGAMRLLDEKSLDSLRDGRRVTYRYNAVLFHKPVDLTGTITGNGAGGTLSGTLEMAADDPLNPYRHRYSPEHRTGFAVTRQITLEFSPDDSNPVNQALGLAETAGNNELTGTYTEVISGLSLEPVTVSGPFRLMRLTESTRWEPPTP